MQDDYPYQVHDAHEGSDKTRAPVDQKAGAGHHKSDTHKPGPEERKGNPGRDQGGDISRIKEMLDPEDEQGDRKKEIPLAE